MRLPLLALLLATAARGDDVPGAAVRQERFSAASLGREVALSVQLPPSYAAGGDRRYPTLYVLHGLFESDAFWQRRGLAAAVQELWRRGELPEMLIVAPDGGNSFFVNGPLGRFEDLLTQDVVAHVEASYRVRRGREGRALLGVSMGGYAALRLALSRPQAFSAVAAHSAMLLARAPTREDGASRWHLDALEAAFGRPIDAALWDANSPLALASTADARAVPALSFDCGASDRFGLQAGNEELHRRLLARGVAHQFALPPGDHGYEYVKTVLPRSLGFLASALDRESARPRAAPR